MQLKMAIWVSGNSFKTVARESTAKWMDACEEVIPLIITINTHMCSKNLDPVSHLFISSDVLQALLIGETCNDHSRTTNGKWLQHLLFKAFKI